MSWWLILLLVLFLISLILEFTRDFYKSLWYCLKTPKKLMDDFYGMIGFLGYYGQGKSMAMTHTINRFKTISKKENAELKIYTNYHYIGQTGQLNSLNDIEEICNKKRQDNDDSYIIFAIDELQNALNSRQWNDSKKLESLLPVFTMTRKLRVMFLYTSPVLSMSDKTIRISSRHVYICKKLNRFFFIRYKLNPVDLEGTTKEVRLPLFPSAHTLLDEVIKNSYDSFAFIETLQKQDYLKHNEVQTFQIGNQVIEIKK